MLLSNQKLLHRIIAQDVFFEFGQSVYFRIYFKLAQLKFTNEKIAPVHYKRKAAIATRVYSLIQYQFQCTTSTILFAHYGSLGYYHNN